MSKKYSAGLPADLDLPSAWTVRFAALSPSTGAAVSGVTVSGASLIATNVEGGDLSTDLFDMVPLFTPIPVNGEG